MRIANKYRSFAIDLWLQWCKIEISRNVLLASVYDLNTSFMHLMATLQEKPMRKGKSKQNEGIRLIGHRIDGLIHCSVGSTSQLLLDDVSGADIWRTVLSKVNISYRVLEGREIAFSQADHTGMLPKSRWVLFRSQAKCSEKIIVQSIMMKNCVCRQRNKITAKVLVSWGKIGSLFQERNYCRKTGFRIKNTTICHDFPLMETGPCDTDGIQHCGGILRSVVRKTCESGGKEQIMDHCGVFYCGNIVGMRVDDWLGRGRNIVTL